MHLPVWGVCVCVCIRQRRESSAGAREREREEEGERNERAGARKPQRKGVNFVPRRGRGGGWRMQGMRQGSAPRADSSSIQTLKGGHRVRALGGGRGHGGQGLKDQESGG